MRMLSVLAGGSFVIGFGMTLLTHWDNGVLYQRGAG